MIESIQGEPSERGQDPLGLLPHFAKPAMTLPLSYEWGRGSLPSPWGEVGVTLTPDQLLIQVSARWTQAPPPGPPPGPLWALWEHEVVELFIVGAEGHYLELELGPFGHHLALELSSVRCPERWCLPVHVRCERAPEQRGLGRWRAEASLARHHLPSPRDAQGEVGYLLNAFACLGRGDARRHLLAAPLPGDAPDFHQPERFPWVSVEALSTSEVVS